jgi:nucleotide-binding universal stress UspA family protein
LYYLLNRGANPPEVLAESRRGQMMKNMLIAIDDSVSAMKAVEYVGRQFGGAKDLKVSLVHVLPNLPSIFWDEGHILSEGEKSERQRVVDKWLADRKAKMEPVFKKAADLLNGQGIPEQQIQMKSISDSTDVASSILEEARDGGYQTIVVGRRGIVAGKHLLLGSVTNKIITQGSGVAITIVE